MAWTAAVLALLSVGADAAQAGACGDRIGGKRVACACGDTVESDTVLSPTDPVVTQRCPGDGLVLVAPEDTDRLTLDLGGQSIVGQGHGAGIRVAKGGRLGAVIVGGGEGGQRAEIARFGTGIRASGRDVLHEVRSIDVHDHTSDGLSIHASGVTIEDVRSEGNGRRGIALSGHGNEARGVTASGNAADGLEVRGSAATVSAETAGNGGNGAVVAGRGHRVERILTTRNGEAGVMATGGGHRIDGMKASGNAGDAVAGRPGAAE